MHLKLSSCRFQFVLSAQAGDWSAGDEGDSGEGRTSREARFTFLETRTERILLKRLTLTGRGGHSADTYLPQAFCEFFSRFFQNFRISP